MWRPPLGAARVHFIHPCSSRENPSYSPAKTSHVAKTTSKQIIKIRNINELLIKSDGGRHETNSSVRKVEFERLEDKEEIKSTMYYKKLLDKDVKGAVEKCLQRFQKTKAILPGEEFFELVNMFVPDFTEKIRSTYLQTHPTENEIAITSADKQYIIDQIILYINLKSSINDYINPMELKIHLQLKLNQKGFAVLKKELVNELFTSLREVNQEAVIAKFARSDQYYTIGHVITNPEKNKISKHWLTKRFVDNALGFRGFNVTTPVVSL